MCTIRIGFFIFYVMMLEKQFNDVIGNYTAMLKEKGIRYHITTLYNYGTEEEICVNFLQMNTGYMVEFNVVGYMTTVEKVYECYCYDHEGHKFECNIDFDASNYINIPSHIVSRLRLNAMKDTIDKVFKWFEDPKFHFKE